MKNYKKYSRARRELQAVAFSLFLLSFFCVSLAMAFFNTGPIILGTEMNANGMVEYMCLGNGCEEFTQLSWNDY